MSKFKVGDKVTCIETDEKEAADNGITYGKTYRVVGIDNDLLYLDSGGTAYCYRFKLYDETEMTAEQIRDEIIRIDVRIEEANTDIKNAENERNSLVEKLREKGFELTRNEDSSEDVEQNNLVGTGDTVRIVKYNPEFHDCDCTGVLAEVLSTDESDRPYYVETDNGFNFWCMVDEVEKI